MIRNRLILISLFVGLLAVYSCGDDNKPTGSGGAPVNPPPNAVGMLWVYEVYDSLTDITDTVWLSVTDTVSLSGGIISLQLRMNWTVADSVVDRYAVAYGDTTDLWSDSTHEPMLLERFVLPLSLGAEWTGVNRNDTSRVTDVRAVTVKAGTFSSAALVERTWNRDFEGGGDWSKTWIAPNVGVVSRYLFSQRSDGSNITITVNQTWELLRYDLSTFSMEQFPNAVGTEWVYQVIDTRFDLVDTVTVTIASEVSLSWADTGTLWQYNGSVYTDTLYVGVIGENLHFSHSNEILSFGSWYYEFPLAVGRHWGAVDFATIPAILDKGAVTTLAGSSPSAFRYQMFDWGYNSSWTVEEWLVPGVGPVLRKTSERDLGPVLSQEWNLISYRPPVPIY